MESFHYYKGYGVRYTGIGGSTYVELNGVKVAAFYGVGRLSGEELAHGWIDEELS